MNQNTSQGGDRPVLRIVQGDAEGIPIPKPTSRNLQPARRPIHQFDLDGIPILSDDEAWATWPVIQSVYTCGRVKLRGVYYQSGMPWEMGLPCRSYQHERCARRTVSVKRDRFVLGASRCDQVFFATVPERQWRSHRISDRLSDKKVFVDDGYCWVRRTDGDPVYLFATLPLTGWTPPIEMTAVEPETAVRLFTIATRLPGVQRIEFNNDWPEPEEEGAGDGSDGLTSVTFGVYTDDVWEIVKDRARALAFQRHGVEVDPDIPVVRRTGATFTVEQWIDCLKQAVAAVDSELGRA